MLDISVLGPTEARLSGTSVSLSPLERNLLAVLALSKGAIVSTDRIVDSLWADRPPVSARSRVQGLVSTLRRKVGEALVTRHPGYLLDPAATTVDADECAALADQARQAPSPTTAAAYLRQALRLWRGEPLDGITAPGVDVDRVRLGELRLSLLEERFAVELELGRHADVVGELTVAVAANPLRERLAEQLMLAMYRCNRGADALRVYQTLRARLADELGSDPCADLRRLHTTIMRGEPVTATAAEPAPEPAELRPAQLPPSVGHFTGRDDEMAALTRAVSRPVDEPRPLLVSGLGGIGKTALVVRWAHSVADRFPDGQIFVDLHGRNPRETLTARGALGVALAALGVAKHDTPNSLDGRAALYRTLTSARRVMIVADDAASVDQVLMLVPPTTTGQLVVTSRRSLAELAEHHAVQAFAVEPLAHGATRELLARIAGPHRLTEPGAATVVRWCGGWPLVTRLAGTRLAARPWQSMASFADELDDLADRVLDEEPRNLRGALASAHDSVSPAAAHLLGRLGLSASALVSVPPSGPAAAHPSARQVRGLLEELVTAHLIMEVDTDRYRLHDVVRRFARQRAADLADRDAVDEWVRHRAVALAD